MERLLGDLDEGRHGALVGLQELAVDDDRVAVGINAVFLTRREAHVVAQQPLEDMVDVVERGGDVDGAALQGRQLGVGFDVDPFHRVLADAHIGGESRPHLAGRVPRRVADLLAGEVFRRLDAGTLQPVEAVGRIGVDVVDGHRLGPLGDGNEDRRQVGQADFVFADAGALRRQGRALALFDVEVDTGVFVPAHLLGVVIRGVVAAGNPVENEINLGGSLGRTGNRKADQRRKYRQKTSIGAHLYILPRILFVSERLFHDRRPPLASPNSSHFRRYLDSGGRFWKRP